MTVGWTVAAAVAIFACGWFGGRWGLADAARKRLDRTPPAPPLSHVRPLPAAYDQDAP